MKDHVERKPECEAAAETPSERLLARIRELSEDDRAMLLDMAERLLHKD